MIGRLKVPAGWACILVFALGLVGRAAAAPQPTDSMKSDLAPAYAPPTGENDYVRREAMIPMRDGVKLYTLIVMRKGISHAPILLERTPYGADGAVGRSSPRLADIVPPADAAYVSDGYIRVWQDVRGRNRSEGVYVTNRPLTGPLNPTGIDHASDAFDTIDWLIHNLPESNGRVGVIGGSYNGFTTLMATLSGHPALKAAVPINPMVDVWTGDDWYHYGAFRQITLNVLPIVMAGKAVMPPPATGGADLYGLMLATGSAGDFMRRYNLDVFPAAQRFMAHPGFDGWWRPQALDQVMAERPIQVPTLLVGGLYDEQDQYGAAAVFRALHPHDAGHRISLLLGPWSHMGINGDGSALGPVRFGEDTAATARREVIKPFLDAHLKDGGDSTAPLPAVIRYAANGGWRRSNDMPETSKPLYLHAGGRLSSAPPVGGEAGQDDYVSDPAKPVPVIARPFPFSGDAWKTSLIADQRFASQRPDVLTYVSEVLDTPVEVFGQPRADLFVATTGTDMDVVVKLIDAYPDAPSEHEMAGYQLPVSMDIFRARYRQDLARAVPFVAGQPEAVRFALPMASHVFAKGHRIMVQVQSSWFPVYDRNPQTFVADIFNAKPGDYRPAVESVLHTPAQPSVIVLPVVGN